MLKKLLIASALLIVLFIGLGGIAYAAKVNNSTTPDTLVVSISFHTIATITDPAEVQALYNAMYALPHVQPPSPSINYGIGPATFVYTIQFFSQHHLLKQVDLLTVSLFGLKLTSSDYRWATPAFWSLFAKTLHTTVRQLMNYDRPVSGNISGPAMKRVLPLKGAADSFTGR